MQAKPMHPAVGTIAAIVVVAIMTLTPSRPAADDIVIAVWNADPQANAEITGREVDIIRHVMGRCGHSVHFATFPFTRHWIAFLQGSVDAVATVPGHLQLDLPGTRTLSYIHYDNGFLVRAADGLRIDHIDDLNGLRVVSFAGARNLLSEIASIAEMAESYIEIGNLSEQVALLLAGRVDAVYADGRLLAGTVRRMRHSATTRTRLSADRQLQFFPIAPSPPFHLVFRRTDLAHEFNRCLMTARLVGEIAAIVARYDDQQAAMFPAPCAQGYGADCPARQSSSLAPAAGISPADPRRDRY